MNRPTEPEDIHALFTIAGKNWSSDQIMRVKAWLYEPDRWPFIRLIALYRLGYRVSEEEAQDAWQAFYTRPRAREKRPEPRLAKESPGDFIETRGQVGSIQQLDQVIANYEPAKGEFWDYFVISFQNFCHEEARKRYERLTHESPLVLEVETGQGEELLVDLAVDLSALTENQLIDRIALSSILHN